MVLVKRKRNSFDIQQYKFDFTDQQVVSVEEKNIKELTSINTINYIMPSELINTTTQDTHNLQSYNRTILHKK